MKEKLAISSNYRISRSKQNPVETEFESENRDRGREIAMAFALSTSASSTCRALQLLFPSTSTHSRLFSQPPSLVLPCHPLSPFTLAFSRRRNHYSSVKSSSSSSSKKKNMKRRSLSREDEDDDDMEDDPFEKLFSLLEEDLKNDASTVDEDSDDEEINEEDIDKLAQELVDVLGDDDMELHDSATDGMESGYNDAEEEEEEEKDEEEEEDDDDDKEEEFEVRLKNWQLKKLAYALKSGRRKVSIKNLAAELCLDRAIVIEMLRNPPPNLLMLSATLPDEPPPVVSVPEAKLTETFTVETSIDAVKPEAKVKEPVHVRQHRWLAQKRLKKVQVKTLEMVYRRSKRPTNAMVSSIVQVTNLPRRRIVQWFEDKRAQEGVPERRAPYQRSDPETVFTS
nr:overexpressor of cationic peroxidase 1 [Litchi chinensis]